MKRILRPVVAVTFFSTLGNAQDDAAASASPASTLSPTTVTSSATTPGVSTPGLSTPGVSTGGVSSEGVAMGYAAQGNVVMNKAQHEAELQRAAQASRQQKALKEAMAAYTQKTPPITTAEQFLAANRPPAMPPREGDEEMSPVRTSTYVPEFEATESRVNRSGSGTSGPPAMSGTAALPERKRGLFDFYKSKKNAPEAVEPGPNPDTLDAPAPPPAGYVQPGAVEATAGAGAGAAPMVDQSEAIAAATVSATAPEEKPDFFSRLFGKGKKSSASEASVPVPAPDVVGTAPAESAEPSATVAPATESGEIPTPPSF